MTTPVLCLKRIKPAHPSLKVTLGRCYDVIKDDGSTYKIRDDDGKIWDVARNYIYVSKVWQMLWLLPDGTELEALE